MTSEERGGKRDRRQKHGGNKRMGKGNHFSCAFAAFNFRLNLDFTHYVLLTV